MTYALCFIAMLGQIVTTKLFTYFLAVLFAGFSVALLGAFLGVFVDND